MKVPWGLCVYDAAYFCGNMSAPMNTPASSQPLREGYWYDSLDPDTPLERDGDRVRRDRAAPPWIVVDEQIASITIGSRWPGRLWRVRVVELGDMSGLVANPGYWRAREIALLEPLPLATLFGPHGHAVMALLARVATLTLAQAEALDAARHPDAEAAYSRAWDRWINPEPATPPEDWSGTLARAGGPGHARSPVHWGFSLLHGLLWKRAEALSGAAAVTRIEEDGEVEEQLAPPWSGACSALLHAAMAQGAPEVVAAADVAVLMQAGTRVFGG